MTSAVLFDLGNVVFRIDFMRAFSVWAEHSGVASDELLGRFRGGESYRQFERGELDEASYFAALAKELDIPLSREQLVYGWNAIYTGALPGLASRLCALGERLPIFAFTNTNATHQAVWQALYGELLTPFRKIYVSSEIGMRKPEPEAFRWVAEDMGTPPSEVLFLDDHTDNVEGARAARMNAIHIDCPERVLEVIDQLVSQPG
ncbi:MAG: HAD-IA family hydrolase, partial [Gammaproteobacteria bacterium]